MIDKYKQAFQDEARELLVELESALLELDQSREDREVLGRAFRALHTIKGSGAMFGYDDIAGFAHNLETAFDRLRTGQLTATADLISLSLAAGDQIKTMLDQAEGRGTADPGRSAEILARLRVLDGRIEPNAGDRAGLTGRGARRRERADSRLVDPLPAGAGHFIEGHEPTAADQ